MSLEKEMSKVDALEGGVLMREQELHSPEKISLSQCSQFHVASGVFLARISAEGVRAANDDEGSYFEIPAKTSQGNMVRVDTLCE